MREPINLMTVEDFDTRVRDAKAGDQIVYHRGLLMHQRQHNKMLRELAVQAYALFQGGMVHLVQRRLDDYVCEYIAQRR